jgi:gamma-glutamylcyclotransferase (GGCT)/AIG2-like uncharacterized protein YtfP
LAHAATEDLIWHEVVVHINCEYLFVYGTLRRGSDHPMAVFLARHARFMAEGKTPGRLLDLGAYPGMVEAKSPDDCVQGDVFELVDRETTLAVLDRYEGCDRADPLYERRQATVTLSTGDKVTVWYYHYRGQNELADQGQFPRKKKEP